jgi:hypothetical protein
MRHMSQFIVRGSPRLEFEPQWNRTSPRCYFGLRVVVLKLTFEGGENSINMLWFILFSASIFKGGALACKWVRFVRCAMLSSAFGSVKLSVTTNPSILHQL